MSAPKRKGNPSDANVSAKQTSKGVGSKPPLSGGDERKRAAKPNSPSPHGRVKDYTLNPGLVYQPNQLDTSDYSGKSVWRRPVVTRLEAPGGDGRQAGPLGASAPGLLKGHISPPIGCKYHLLRHDRAYVEVWDGASLVRVRTEDKTWSTKETVRLHRKRGKVREFSRGSQRRMRQFLAKIRLDSENLPLFGTTTYPDSFPDEADKVKRDISTLTKRIKRRFPGCALLWRLEYKRRRSGENAGKVAPHFHWLLWGIPWKFDFRRENGEWIKLRKTKGDLWETEVTHIQAGETQTTIEHATGQDRFTEWLSRNWYDITKTGDLRHYHAGTNVKKLKSIPQVFGYVSKYLGKVQEDSVCSRPGRFWGVVNAKNLPMGARVQVPCTAQQGKRIMRVMRRYLKSKGIRLRYINRTSLSCICNASWWLECLPRLLGLFAR